MNSWKNQLPATMVWFMTYMQFQSSFQAMAQKPDQCIWILNGKVIWFSNHGLKTEQLYGTALDHSKTGLVDTQLYIVCDQTLFDFNF